MHPKQLGLRVCITTHHLGVGTVESIMKFDEQQDCLLLHAHVEITEEPYHTHVCTFRAVKKHSGPQAL